MLSCKNWAVLAAGLLAAGPVCADTLTLPPWTMPVGDATLRLDGMADGALFGPSDRDGAQVSGALRAMPEIRRDYDSGLSLGVGGTFAATDPLSRGRYDGDAIERLAGTARTGLGTVEIGLTDGAGYALAVTGPKVDTGVSLEDPRTSFFRDPNTGHAVTDLFALRTAVGASSNYAKFVYTSPEVFGVQLALSFTPTEGKQLPFLQAGPHLPGRQADIWEAALRYSDEVGPVTLSAYGALAEGRAEHKLPGQEGVSDLGAGLRADYPLTEEIGVSLGGSYRQSNAYGFDINRAYQTGTTRAAHISGGVTYDAWAAGLEYGTGVGDAVAVLPRLGQTGLEASLGYTLSSSAAVSGGWQHLRYGRGSGVFYNGLPQLKMDAVYLHLNLKTSEQ